MTIGRQLASATLQLTLGNALVRLLSLVTMPFLTRVLTPNSYGVASLTGTATSLVSVVALAGLDMSYARAYHSKSAPSGEEVERYAWRFSLTAGTCAGIAAAVLWCLAAPTLSLPAPLALPLAVGILFCVANTMAQTRARLRDQYRLMSISLLTAGIASACVGLATAYWWRQDAWPLVLTNVVGFVIPVLILGVPRHTELTRPSGLTTTERADVLRIGLAGIVTAPAYWVLSSMDRWFLSYFHDTGSVGIYSIAYSIAVVGMMVSNALHAVWLPEAAREYERDSSEAPIVLGALADRIIIVLGIVWLAIAAAGGDAVRLLTAGRFHAAAELVPYIAGGVYFNSVLHLANGCLLLVKKMHLCIAWWIGGTAFSIALNFLLVPSWGRVGAAVTQALSFAFVACGIVVSAHRYIPLRTRRVRLLSSTLLLLVLGIFMHPPWSSSIVASLLLKLPVGIAVAFAAVHFVSPEFASDIVHRLRWSSTGHARTHRQ